VHSSQLIAYGERVLAAIENQYTSRQQREASCTTLTMGQHEHDALCAYEARVSDRLRTHCGDALPPGEPGRYFVPHDLTVTLIEGSHPPRIR
jgi:hypothetical protein